MRELEPLKNQGCQNHKPLHQTVGSHKTNWRLKFLIQQSPQTVMVNNGGPRKYLTWVIV